MFTESKAADISHGPIRRGINCNARDAESVARCPRSMLVPDHVVSKETALLLDSIRH